MDGVCCEADKYKKLSDRSTSSSVIHHDMAQHPSGEVRVNGFSYVPVEPAKDITDIVINACITTFRSNLGKIVSMAGESVCGYSPSNETWLAPRYQGVG